MAMAIWSVWTNADDSQISLTPGEGPPRFGNGTSDPGATTRLWLIEAATYEEAATIHHLRLGWGTYKPMGEAAPCLRCGALFWPEGSGVCQCDDAAA
ncbi:hypothetical protein [Roseateles sp. LYH14W]|uniref:DUF35 domain-containing protein n=1 Tax=Pelomonas parva TaxID=3299032 RepID=A0ABW7FB68_9BURK